jgi:hypothetical protein
MRGWLRAVGRSEAFWLIALLILSAWLRVHHLIGFGLGDDPYYGFTSKAFLNSGFDALNRDFGSNYRVGLWLPISSSFRLFGIGDFSFVLFPLLSSTLLVGVVYFTGRLLVGRDAAWFAALVQAFSSFDVTFSSTMTIDIPASFLLATSFLLFFAAERVGIWANLAFLLLASLLVLWAFFIRLPALVMVGVFGILTLVRWRHLPKHLALYGFLALALAGFFLFEYLDTGDPLNYLHRELEFSPQPGPFRELWRLYPDWMFTTRNWLGVLLFGFHFYLASAAILYCLARRELRRVALPFFAWIGVTFAFLEFYPVEWSLPLKGAPRFFRYTHALIPPTCLLIGIAMAPLWRWAGRGPRVSVFVQERRLLGASRGQVVLVGLLAVYAYASVSLGFATARLYDDHYEDARSAARFIASLPPKGIYSDAAFFDRFNFYTGYSRMGQIRWTVGGRNVHYDLVKNRDLEPLRGLRDGYVVMGGSRGVDYASQWILTRGDFDPPGSWKQVFEHCRPVTPHRPESLRVYRAE